MSGTSRNPGRPNPGSGCRGLDSLRPPKPDDKTKQVERYLKRYLERYPYFSRLEFLEERGFRPVEAAPAATRDAELMVIAPCTADLMAKLAAGSCDDPVTLAALISKCPKLLCPAMNDAMWESPVVQRNLATTGDLGP